MAAYEVHLVDSVRDRLRKMVKKDSVNYKRLVKLFGQLARLPLPLRTGLL